MVPPPLSAGPMESPAWDIDDADGDSCMGYATLALDHKMLTAASGIDGSEHLLQLGPRPGNMQDKEFCRENNRSLGSVLLLIETGRVLTRSESEVDNSGGGVVGLGPPRMPKPAPGQLQNSLRIIREYNSFTNVDRGWAVSGGCSPLWMLPLPFTVGTGIINIC
jgi:hypothetical protein